jgi:hypothetical protein
MTHRFSSLFLSISLLLGAACATKPAPAKPDVAAKEPSIDRAKLRAALEAKRKLSLERFLAYRDARSYPRNTYQPGLQHVWLDEEGRLCAAATLISGDWGFDATAKIAEQDNFIQLAGVHDGALADWMLTSGLTHHEIVAIQEPMEYPRQQFDQDAEIERLYGIYTSVVRQIQQLWDESLDEAVEALMARPDLAAKLMA